MALLGSQEGVGPTLTEYQPSLYDTIGGTLFQMVNNLQSATEALTKGNIEKGIGDLFSLPAAVTAPIEQTGGDWGVAAEWSEFFGYGGTGGGKCPECRFDNPN